MDNKIDLWCLDGTLIEIKSETEDPLESDDVTDSDSIVCCSIVQIKEEPVTLKCEEEEAAVVPENSFSHTEDIKIEVKEEAWWLHRSSTDVHYETKETEEIIVLDSPAKETSRLCSISDDSAVKPNTNEKSSSRLKLRKLKPQTERPHKCEICEESFVALSNLKLHKLIHEIQREYTCEICKMNFKNFRQLKRHFLTHTLKCEICGKSFGNVSHLKEHRLTHDGKTPFVCEVCEKTFTRLSNLKRHALIHEGKGSVKCEICEKTFSRLLHLKNHKLIHEGKRPYECEICKKTFITMSHLKRHKVNHNGK